MELCRCSTAAHIATWTNIKSKSVQLLNIFLFDLLFSSLVRLQSVHYTANNTLVIILTNRKLFLGIEGKTCKALSPFLHSNAGEGTLKTARSALIFACIWWQKWGVAKYKIPILEPAIRRSSLPRNLWARVPPAPRASWRAPHHTGVCAPSVNTEWQQQIRHKHWKQPRITPQKIHTADGSNQPKPRNSHT